jgi:hypothetical protein
MARRAGGRTIGTTRESRVIGRPAPGQWVPRHRQIEDSAAVTCAGPPEALALAPGRQAGCDAAHTDPRPAVSSLLLPRTQRRAARLRCSGVGAATLRKRTGDKRAKDQRQAGDESVE